MDGESRRKSKKTLREALYEVSPSGRALADIERASELVTEYHNSDYSHLDLNIRAINLLLSPPKNDYLIEVTVEVIPEGSIATEVAESVVQPREGNKAILVISSYDLLHLYEQSVGVTALHAEVNDESVKPLY